MLPAVTASYEIPVAALFGEAYGDIWICGRPVLIGTNVFVLFNVRGVDVLDTQGILVIKGENRGAGPWTLYDTIATGDLDGWQRPADTYTDGTRLYVLYAASDHTLQLIYYEPPALAVPVSVALSIPNLALSYPDVVRLVKRALGDFVAVWTVPSHDPGPTPGTVFAAYTTGISFESSWSTPIELTPDLRQFPSSSWNLLDAIVGTDDKLHVLASATDGGHFNGRLLHAALIPDNSVSSALVLSSYKVAAPLQSEGTRGTIWGGKIYWPVVFSDGPTPYENDWWAPVILSANEFSADDWEFEPISSEDPEADNISNPFGTAALVIGGHAYAFFPQVESPHFKGLEYTSSPQLPESLIFPIPEELGDAVDAGATNYEQVSTSVISTRYIGIVSQSLIPVDDTFIRKFAFRLIDIGASGGGPRARYYGW